MNTDMNTDVNTDMNTNINTDMNTDVNTDINTNMNTDMNTDMKHENTLPVTKKVLKRNITKLLICGGGFKFFYLVGAIKYLHHINVIQNINEYIGISAGSMLAFLFVLGYI